MSQIIKGTQLKPLICKNDNCMKILGYISKDDVQILGSLLINLKCQRCNHINEWRFGYSKLEQQIAMINRKLTTKGGE